MLIREKICMFVLVGEERLIIWGTADTMWEVPRSKAHKEIIELETFIIKYRHNRGNESERDTRDRAEPTQEGGKKWRGERRW